MHKHYPRPKFTTTMVTVDGFRYRVGKTKVKDSQEPVTVVLKERSNKVMGALADSSITELGLKTPFDIAKYVITAKKATPEPVK